MSGESDDAGSPPEPSIAATVSPACGFDFVIKNVGHRTTSLKMPQQGIGRSTKPCLNDIREEQWTICYLFKSLQMDNQRHFPLTQIGLSELDFDIRYLSGHTIISWSVTISNFIATAALYYSPPDDAATLAAEVPCSAGLRGQVTGPYSHPAPPPGATQGHVRVGRVQRCKTHLNRRSAAK
jgi:hypothetical protein